MISRACWCLLSPSPWPCRLHWNRHVILMRFWHDDVIKWKHFRVTGHLCGEFTGPGEFTAQRPVTRSFDVFFDLRLNTRLSKQPWGWWFETLLRPLWRYCNGHWLHRKLSSASAARRKISSKFQHCCFSEPGLRGIALLGRRLGEGFSVTI